MWTYHHIDRIVVIVKAQIVCPFPLILTMYHMLFWPPVKLLKWLLTVQCTPDQQSLICSESVIQIQMLLLFSCTLQPTCALFNYHAMQVFYSTIQDQPLMFNLNRSSPEPSVVWVHIVDQLTLSYHWREVLTCSCSSLSECALFTLETFTWLRQVYHAALCSAVTHCSLYYSTISNSMHT